MLSDQQKQQYATQGFFITDDAVDPAMLDDLVAAARRACAKWRSGAVVVEEDGVKVGGGEVNEEGNGNIEGVLAPEYGEPVFAEYLASDRLLNYAKSIQGEQLRLGWITLCANQSGYDTGWHRDINEEDRDGDYEAEMAVLARNLKHHCKWTLALADDAYLLLIPGSHRRYRTDHERECLVNTKFADIPGQYVVELKKGQTLFWDGNIIHRGRAPEGGPQRLTLRAGLFKYQQGEGIHDLGSRFSWMRAANMRAALPAPLQLYYDRWWEVQPPEEEPVL